MLFVVFPWHFESNDNNDNMGEIERSFHDNDEVWIAPFDGVFEISSSIFNSNHHFWIDGRKIELQPWLETKLLKVGQNRCLYEFFIENVGHIGHKMTINNRDILGLILEQKIRIKHHGFKSDIWQSYVGGHQMFKWASWRLPSVPLFFEKETLD